MTRITKCEARLGIAILLAVVSACGAELDPRNEAATALALGECTTTHGCQQIYPGATDCDNAGGGVCKCGSDACSAGNGGGDSGAADQCNTTAECRDAYGDFATDCKDSWSDASVCLCGGSTRCDAGGDGGGDDGDGGSGPPPAPSGKAWVAVAALTDDFSYFDSGKWQQGHPYWSGRSPSKFNDANISYHDGKLRLKGSLKNAARTGDFIWTACLTSMTKSFKRGMYAEARIKNADMAIVSSFWMQGSYSEIDVIENWGDTTNPSWRHLAHTMEMNTHYFIDGWSNDKTTQRHYANPGEVGNADAYAVYGVWWKDSRNIIWYRDGVQVASVTLPYDFNEDMYMFFDMEAFTWGPGVAPNTHLNDPARNLAYYDYVKTYRLQDAY